MSASVEPIRVGKGSSLSDLRLRCSVAVSTDFFSGLSVKDKCICTAALTGVTGEGKGCVWVSVMSLCSVDAPGNLICREGGGLGQGYLGWLFWTGSTVVPYSSTVVAWLIGSKWAMEANPYLVRFSVVG